MSRIESESRRMGLLVDDLLLLAPWTPNVPSSAARSTCWHWPATRYTTCASIRSRGAASRWRWSTAPARRRCWATRPGCVRCWETRWPTRQHTPDTSPITVRVGTAGDDAVLEVADQGPGMTPEDAQRGLRALPDRADSRARASGGTGLGPSIVDSLVYAHGGRVTVTTARRAGGCFRVSLPRIADVPAPIG